MVQQVIVGTVGRPHGLRGEVLVRPRTDQIELRFATGQRLVGGGRTWEVVGHKLVADRLVVSFAGVSDRSSAEALRGMDVWADSETDVLGDDEFHISTLVGLDVRSPDGEVLGSLTGVERREVQDLLVVRTPAGERLVPFVAELVPSVVPDEGYLVVNPIPGLLDEVPDAD